MVIENYQIMHKKERFQQIQLLNVLSKAAVERSMNEKEQNTDKCINIRIYISYGNFINYHIPKSKDKRIYRIIFIIVFF